MLPSATGTPDLARHLDDHMRAQERQLVGVRLAVVVLGIGFLVAFGESINGRLEITGLLVVVAAYSLLVRVMLGFFPTRPVAAVGVALDAVAVTAVVRLATNVPDSYLFYALVTLGVAIRFGMVPAIASAVALSVTYLGVVVTHPLLDSEIGPLLPVRMLFLIMFGVVAGLFSRVLISGAAENARLQLRLEAEEAERTRGAERELLSRLGRDFGASLDREETRRAITSGAAPVLGDATMLLAHDPTERRLVPAAVDGPNGSLAARWWSLAIASPPKLAAGGGVIGAAAAERGQHLTRASDNGQRKLELDDIGVDWMLATPIVAGGRLLGVLATVGVRGRECDQRIRRMAEALAERAGPALQNADLWSDLQEQVAREREAQRVKDDFLSVVSHELRTPLTSIQGYSQLLESRMTDERGRAKELAHVRVILSQVMRMRRLVDDLLDVHRMDRRGGVTIEPIDFDLAELLGQAVARARRTAPERDIGVDAPSPLHVMLDRDRLDQVLANILENAVKYSPDGGPIRVTAIDRTDAVEVRISDTGVGVPPADRERVFERFYQADDDEGRRRRFGGLGLGLSISRAIVEGHGGQIWASANDEAGRGSVFAFRVPRRARRVTLAPFAEDEEDEAPPFVKRRTGT